MHRQRERVSSVLPARTGRATSAISSRHRIASHRIASRRFVEAKIGVAVEEVTHVKTQPARRVKAGFTQRLAPARAMHIYESSFSCQKSRHHRHHRLRSRRYYRLDVIWASRESSPKYHSPTNLIIHAAFRISPPLAEESAKINSISITYSRSCFFLPLFFSLCPFVSLFQCLLLSIIGPLTFCISHCSRQSR